MKKEIFITIGITFLFLSVGIQQVYAIENISSGYIQDLIDNASDGDTIYIPSGIYFENIVIDKSINLIGEDKTTTIIDAGGKGSVIKVIANYTQISGFTLQNSGKGDDKGGITSFSNYNKFFDNNIINNKGTGICLDSKSPNDNEKESNHNKIYMNNIENNGFAGICIFGDYLTWNVKFRYNEIYKNVISNNNDGISVGALGCNNNLIYDNIISNNNDWGISVWGKFNFIIGNNIENHNEYGIYLTGSFGTLIKKNNFINNKRNAYFELSFANRWVRNYWDTKLTIFGPKIIRGILYFPFPYPDGLVIPIQNFDWRPARNPYDI